MSWFFGSPCEGEPLEGKHRQWDPTSLCSEHPCPKHFGLGLEIRTVEVCGSDEWQIGLHEEWTTFYRSVRTPADAVTILLTELGWTWTEGRPSHPDTLECVWLSMLYDNDGTMWWSSTGARTSLLSEFLLVCLCRLPLLSCPLQLALFGSDTGPWTFEGPGSALNSRTFMCSLFPPSDHRSFVELWFKWAPQPSFDMSKELDAVVFGIKVCISHHACGVLPPVQVCRNWFCPRKEAVQQLRISLKLKGSHVKASLQDHFLHWGKQPN